MTSNGNFDGESLTPWLQSVGFQRNPFSLPFAENQPTDMFQRTYFVADELEQLMLHQEKSVAFLAPYGGGKTAARRYTQFRWEEQYPHAFITVYDNFTAVAEQLPRMSLNTHREPLLAATAESFWGYINQKPEKLLALPEHNQRWWWALLHHYLPGELLDFRVHSVPGLAGSYLIYTQMGEDKVRPFRADESVTDILKTIRRQLDAIGLVHWLILVDKIDGAMHHHVDALQGLLHPLLNTLTLFRMSIAWKLFLPHEVQEMVTLSSSCLRRDLEIANINWERDNLWKFLENRISWATDNSHKSLASFSSEFPQVDEYLVEMAYQHRETFGAPRTLLKMGDDFLSRLAPESLITKKDWQQFLFSLPAYWQMKNAEMGRLQSVSRDKLADALESHFSLEEMRGLVFKLWIDFENIAGDTKIAKAQSLIEYCERYHRIPQLTKLLCKERPNASICQKLFSTTS